MATKKSLKDKNILYLTHTYTNFVKFPIEILSKEFNHVYVLVRHKPLDLLAKILPISLFRYYSSSNQIDLKNIPSNVTVIPMVIWYLPLDWFYKRLGVWHLNATLKTIKKYKIKFDMIHSHILWTAGFVGMHVAKEYNVPFVATAHGADVYTNPYKDSIWMKNIVEVMKGTQELITVSQNNLKVMRSFGVKRKVHVIPNGFNDEKFFKEDKNKLRDELGLPKDKKIFLFVGRLNPVKGVTILLQAIEKIKNVLKDSYFVLVGGGDLYFKLKKEIKNRGLEDLVRLADMQPHDTVIKYDKASDFAVLPTYKEGMPTVCFEFMAAGLPIVASRVGGIPEIINKELGILVEAGDVQELADAILKAKDRKWNTKTILDESKKYTWRKVCEKTLEVYSKLL